MRQSTADRDYHHLKVLISIITPTFQAGSTLRETLESVRSQYGGDTEHLLMDAASTDETLEIAKGYPHLIVKSEKDRGIYDGMNKGASLATGEWLLFLQGDDWLPAGTLDSYRRAIASHPGAEMFCGDCEAVKERIEGWTPVWSVKDRDLKKLTVQNIALGEPMINARLIRRDVFLKLGGFSLNYSLASDRDFLLRCAEIQVPQAEIPAATYRYRWHAGSSTMTEGNALTAKLFRENLSIAKKHLQGTSEGSRRVLLKWHDRLAVQAAMNALEHFQGGKLLQSVREGMSENPTWIAGFTMEILRSLPGFLFRGGKTRTQLLKEWSIA